MKYLMHNGLLARLLPTMIMSFLVQPALGRPPSFVAATYGRAQHLVAVESGRRLNLICMGHGKPVVIFLSGLGSGSIDWRKVQPSIGQITEACTYDRAGYGFSDPATRPSDATQAVADLHALIRAAGLPQPVMLVGHSLGGLYATLYAKTYPKSVAGMLLVDPAFEGQSKAFADVVGPRAAQQLAASQTQALASVDRCAALAKLGQLSLPAEANSDCLDNPPDADPDVHRERNREAMSAGYELAVGSEVQNANITTPDGTTMNDMESAHIGASLGAMPLVVLTRGDLNRLPGLTADEAARAEAAWKAGHDRVAALSSKGTNIVVPHSGHFIQLDQPGIVITQLKHLIAKVQS